MKTIEILLCLSMSALCVFLTTDVSGQALTAGAALVAGKAEVNDIVDHAGDNGRVLIGDLGVQVNNMLDHMGTLMGTEITKPMTELTRTAQSELAVAHAMVEDLRRTASSLPRCIGHEGDLALAGIKGGLQTAINSLPLTNTEPMAYLVESQSSRSPYAVVAKSGENVPLLLRGADLWHSEDLCSIGALAEPLTHDGSAVVAKVLSHDPEKIATLLPPDLAPGEWLLKISAKRRGFLGCLNPKEESVAAAFQVIQPPHALVTVSVTPVCAGYEYYEQKFVGSCTNGSHSEKKCPSTVVFDKPGFELVDYEFHPTNLKHARAAATRNGNALQIDAAAEGGSWTGGHGGGHATWEGVLRGRRPIGDQPQTSIQISLPRELFAGDSAAFEVNWNAPPRCEVSHWVLAGTARFNVGSPIALPATTGATDTELVTFYGGVTARLNSLAKKGTVSLADQGCLE